jgi:heavy metal sensor kinase
MMQWWSVASIRTRLTVWYAGVLALTLVVYATAIFFAVRHEFLERFDDALHEDFESLEGRLIRTADGRIAALGTGDHEPHADDERAYDVWSIDGELLHRSGDGGAGLLAARAITSHRGYEALEVNGTHWRTLTGSTMVGDRAVTLRVSRSLEPLRVQLREILVVLGLGLPLIVALAAAGGYTLARRALAPIDRLGSDARRITADRLSERLSVPNQHDEIGRLAAVINETFARLQKSFDRLRRFTADASHELRTPLAVIRGIGEAGLAQPRTETEYRDVIGSMLEEVDRVTTLVDSLLRLSHADAGTVRLVRSSVDLRQLTHDVVTSLSILADEKGQRLVAIAGMPVVVFADGLVLREALTNVVDNAIKYSPRGSTIEVGLRIAGEDAVLTVADEGPGIAPEHRERIFDRFFRVDEGRSRDRGGTGLGLAIAKWAVEINGGEITVDHRPGGGSIFRIVMPVDSTGQVSAQPPQYESLGGAS